MESQGLTPALEQLAEKMRDTHEQNVIVDIDKNVERLLNAHQQGVVFYLIEEAVGNARKHAKADLIKVNIRSVGDNSVEIKVIDDGQGFDTVSVEANYDQRGSLGFANIRERVALLNGTLKIDSAVGKGTTVSALIPVKS